MKLAEALIQRADYQKRLEQLKQRLADNAKVQEGNKPAENPDELLKEMEHISRELVVLIQLINRTNAATDLVPDDMTIADAIAERDVMRLRYSMYSTVANAALIRQDRYSKSEVRFRSTVDVADMRRRADDLAREIRQLDTRIQEANWKIDLLE